MPVVTCLPAASLKYEESRRNINLFNTGTWRQHSELAKNNSQQRHCYKCPDKRDSHEKPAPAALTPAIQWQSLHAFFRHQRDRMRGPGKADL